jgi:hypothetical protein
MNPITRILKRYIKTPLRYALPLLFIGCIALVSISGCTSPATTSPSPLASSVPTATPTAVTTAQATKSVAKATATPQPTAKPSTTPADPSSFLLEQPATASGPDLSAQINANMSGAGQTFYRVTIDGHDAYAAHNESNAFTSTYVFPCSSYSEAQALQAHYVAVFQAHGYSVGNTSQDPWGPNSILTGLNNGKTVISAGTDTNTVPSILGVGAEVDILVGS